MKNSALDATRTLFWFTCVILVVFGIGSLLRIGGNPSRAGLYIFYALAMFGDAVLMGISAWQLPKRTKAVFFFSVSVLALNILPTIFDQFGLVDLLFVLLNLATLAFLITARKEFLPA